MFQAMSDRLISTTLVPVYRWSASGWPEDFTSENDALEFAVHSGRKVTHIRVPVDLNHCTVGYDGPVEGRIAPHRLPESPLHP